MKFLCLAVLSLTAIAAESAGSYDGPELPYNLYTESCDDANIQTTGRTTALTSIAPNTLCETDIVVVDAEGTTVTTYTKFESVECQTEFFRAKLYNCADASCSMCDDVPEADGTVPAASIIETHNDAQGCLQLYPSSTDTTDGITFGNLTGVSAQAFDASVNLADSQNYWGVFYNNTCGEDFLTKILADPSTSTASGMASVSAAVLVGLVGAAATLA